MARSSRPSVSAGRLSGSAQNPAGAWLARWLTPRKGSGPSSRGNKGVTIAAYGDHMNVEVVRWPADSMRLAELREASVPRLLVVADDAEPPVPVDCLEDWVTAAAPERE